jgi:aspartate racemase
VLGCTEISLLVGPGDTPVPLFDTTALHCQSAVEVILGLHAKPASLERVSQGV